MNAPHPAQPGAPGFEAFDQLATMVALVRADGRCLQANSALENAVGMSRRSLQRGSIFDWLPDPGQLRETLMLVASDQVITSRFDAQLKRLSTGGAELPVHVIVSQTEGPDQVMMEIIEVEQQTRLDRCLLYTSRCV